MDKVLLKRAPFAVLRKYFSSQTPVPKPSVLESSNPRISPTYRPSEFQKTILVWTKKYKNKEEIPKYVSPDLIERARSEARIKIANYLMLLTALGSLTAIVLGKSAAKRGESIYTINEDFHKQYREDYNKAHDEKSK